MGHSVQQMKHENAQKISPNSSPNSSPRLPPESSKFVAPISFWGKSGVRNCWKRGGRPDLWHPYSLPEGLWVTVQTLRRWASEAKNGRCGAKQSQRGWGGGQNLARVPLQNLVMKFFPEIPPVLLCRVMGILG